MVIVTEATGMSVKGTTTESIEEVTPKIIIDANVLERKHLESINPQMLSYYSDTQLTNLHDALHKIYKEIGKVTEPLANAHIFVINEMKKRRIFTKKYDDPLTKETIRTVEEYPTLSDNKKLTIEEILASFPEEITLQEPFTYLVGRTVNEKVIYPSLGSDVDILFTKELDKEMVKSVLASVARENPTVAGLLHFCTENTGPSIGESLPLYRLILQRIQTEELKETLTDSLTTPQLWKPSIGMKSKTGLDKFEFYDVDKHWNTWASRYISEGIIVQPKMDGLRFSLHYDSKIGKVALYTEDRKRDRHEVFTQSIKELKMIEPHLSVKANSLIAEVELVEYHCNNIETKNITELCIPLPREEMIKWVSAKKENLDDSYVVFWVHDIMYMDGKDVHSLPYEERYSIIDQIFSPSLWHWKVIPSRQVTDIKGFYKAINDYKHYKGSEGAVAKVASSPYIIKYTGEARTDQWSKFRNTKELDCMVWKVVQKKTKDGQPLDQYMYECLISIPESVKEDFKPETIVKIKGKYYHHIGRTYSTKAQHKAGDIITVRVVRIAKYGDSTKGNLTYTWMFPYYFGPHSTKKEPHNLEYVEKMESVGIAPLDAKESLANYIISLPPCPFYVSTETCPLRHLFNVPKEEQELTSVLMKEFLRFPIKCELANHYRCKWVKPYYYGIKKVNEGVEVDEDTGGLE